MDLKELKKLADTLDDNGKREPSATNEATSYVGSFY
ncbi:hypothetical protein SAMN06272722_10388 [Paenibacillus sp. RU5A]|nr:hypothetical protein SAMN06272722_10388 [Paenibacillus sp. RU5A]SOC68776.1 hypothetical protein SAMN05880581_10388 [Paenibacillus sp. RU26A]SOC71215.1 hypothetical protein SAMN05880586_10388 [Paenibacillus sp. RU5M]